MFVKTVRDHPIKTSNPCNPCRNRPLRGQCFRRTILTHLRVGKIFTQTLYITYKETVPWLSFRAKFEHNIQVSIL